MTFHSFETIEEAFEHMALAEAEANWNVTPSQAAITWGDHFARCWQDPYGEGVVWIFGRISTWEELEADSLRLCEDEEEVAGELESYRSSHQRGYRFAFCSSLWEPTGEYGSTHVAEMLPIDRATYDKAKAAGWNPRVVEDELRVAWQQVAVEAHAA